MAQSQSNRRRLGHTAKRDASLRVLFGLYRRNRHQLTSAQRRAARSLLRDASRGRLTRSAAMQRSTALVAGTGLSAKQAWRRLRLSPYYRHVLNVLND